MALAGANRGAGSTNTGGESTLAVVPASNCTAGALLVLCASYDNSVVGGGDPYSSIADTKSNTWTSRQNALNDPGSADQGVAMRIFTTPQAGGTLTTGDTITITYSTTTVARSWTLTEFTGAGGTPTYLTGAVETSTTGSPTITSSSLTNGDGILAVVGREGNVPTPVPDSDTTNGSWSTAQESGVGVTEAGSEIQSQYKIVTADGTQSYDPTYGATPRDNCEGWISIREVGGSQSHIGGVHRIEQGVVAVTGGAMGGVIQE